MGIRLSVATPPPLSSCVRFPRRPGADLSSGGWRRWWRPGKRTHRPGMSMRAVPRWMLIAGVLAATVVFVAVAVLAWGPWREFFANPARLGVVVATLLLTMAACFSD